MCESHPRSCLIGHGGHDQFRGRPAPIGVLSPKWHSPVVPSPQEQAGTQRALRARGEIIEGTIAEPAASSLGVQLTRPKPVRPSLEPQRPSRRERDRSKLLVVDDLHPASQVVWTSSYVGIQPSLIAGEERRTSAASRTRDPKRPGLEERYQCHSVPVRWTIRQCALRS